MKGIRVQNFAEACERGGEDGLLAGCYWAVASPEGPYWLAVTPGGHFANLKSHDVIEHEDGTLTVSPSILVTNPQQGELWHGYLEKGKWREV